MNQVAQVAAVIPAHVPPERVRDFQFENLPNVQGCPMRSASAAARQGPDIFYALGVRKDGGAAWIITTLELAREVFQNTEVFSSKGNAGFSALLGETWDLLPLEVDPPELDKWRTLMNPAFSPKRIKSVEADVAVVCEQLIDKILDQGEAEFVHDFAEIFPVTIVLSLLGLPLEHTPQFKKWEDAVTHSPTLQPRMEAAEAIRAYLVEVIADRRATPRDDMISYVLTTPVEGRLITEQEALAICFLVFIAGLDTVAATLGFIFKDLAENPGHQRRLRDDPSLIPAAVEEYLRAFPVVLSHRLVTRDVEFHGVQMKAGDRVTLPTMLAGRDACEFANPDEIDFDREKVNHLTFAAGPHRCLGSHLARRELTVALEQWLARVPPFRVKAGETPRTHTIGLFGVDYLPLVW